MPDAPSADGLRRGSRVRAVVQAARFTPIQKLLLLGLNAWPLAHVVAAVAWMTLPPWTLAWRLGATTAWILFVPPVLCRIVGGRGFNAGEIAVPSRPFFRWWMTWQLQMLFNRLPWIDELLRFVPGFYSAWLRLWGARIGRLTLWSPGVRISDRPLLQIGDDVVVGLDVRLYGHFAGLDAAGRAVLTLGTVTIGDRTSVGGCALLGPGIVLGSDQATEALFIGNPAALWRGGERIREHESPSSPTHPKS